MSFVEVILFGLSVCTDCFAVALCSAVSLKRISPGRVLKIALCFAVVQTGFLLAGWLCGDALAGILSTVSKWISLALLCYVGGQMLCSSLSHKESEEHNLDGVKNILLGAAATSLDALAIGGSLSLAGQSFSQTLPQSISVFICTMLSVIAGIYGGGKIADSAGKWAEGIGGIILIGIGISIVL